MPCCYAAKRISACSRSAELTPVRQQLEYVGPLPEGAQRITLFTAAISANSPNPAAAKQLRDFLYIPRCA